MTSRKKTKGPFERVVDAISDFMGGSMSDMTDEIAPAKKKRASGRRRASVKRTANKRTAKKRTAKKRTAKKS